MTTRRIVSYDEWEGARQELLAKEKAATRARDALAAERRRLPMVRIEKGYAFEGPEGPASLLDLFDGRRQLILYRFFFDPGMSRFPEAGCPGCSMFTDQIGHLAHINARDTTLALVSRASQPGIEQYKRRLGWAIPWYTPIGDDFQKARDTTEFFKLDVYVREGDRIFLTYETRGRGVEALGPVWTFLDLTPLGRQEEWEDSPPGRPQTPPYQWWRKHDEYEQA